MAIELPNGKISRTLPEQVGFNSKKIAEIIKAINDFELVDKVIDLDSASGVLTDTQFGIAELSPSYILYSGKIFIKAYEDGTNIDFIEVGALAGGSTTLTLSVERFRVVVSTKAYQYAVVQLFESYTKNQIDTLLAAKANLSGAAFTGAITAPSIIEDMSGYSAAYGTPANLQIENIYVGMCKNGNKLTLVMACNVERTGSVSTGTLCFFNVPSSIFNKLYPTQIAWYASALSYQKITAIDASASSKIVDFVIEKGSGESNQVKFSFLGGPMNELTLNTKYYIRIEQTFLLSDNLIQ